jgi:peptidyl-tRNA hydrolase, PTH1 family
MKLVVGLGNPGKEYAGTRHNIGFDVIDRLAGRLGLIAKPGDFDRLAKAKFDGLTMDGIAPLPGGGSEKVLLLKPLTYMNLSGRSVNAAMAFYQLTPKEIIIVLDDLALPCGKIRLRAGGSSGGHNGLKDIEQVLASSAYPRLRLGIDAPPGRVPAKDYVLGRFSEDQRAGIEPAIDRAVSAIQLWIESGIESAMNRFNADGEKSDK